MYEYENEESYSEDVGYDYVQLMEDDEITAEEEGFLLGCEKAEQEE